MIGRKFFISGMAIEIIADDGESWETRNTTTGQIVYMDKAVLERAVKLGKAEEIFEPDDNNNN